MTPLGHTGWSLLLGMGLSKVLPGIDPKIIITATTIGGIAVDLDLLYRWYQKGKDVFDKTIGQHRFFPSHTPLFLGAVSLLIGCVNFYWGVFLFIGAMGHLFLDTLFFPEGINFGWPITKNSVHFFTIKTHPFWAPREVSNIDGWWKNYLVSPLFWIGEMVPVIIAVAVLLS